MKVRIWRIRHIRMTQTVKHDSWSGWDAVKSPSRIAEKSHAVFVSTGRGVFHRLFLFPDGRHHPCFQELQLPGRHLPESLAFRNLFSLETHQAHQ